MSALLYDVAEDVTSEDVIAANARVSEGIVYI